MQAGPLYRPLIVPCGSICASTRIERLLWITKPPCELTVSVHLSPVDDWTAPFVIVRVSGVCSREHCLPWAVLFDTCADTPTYLPSNAVAGGPGAWAAAGVVNAKPVIIKNTF